nr:uncharacterized protein LOC128703817 [Cherax quadricarinatus]
MAQVSTTSGSANRPFPTLFDGRSIRLEPWLQSVETTVNAQYDSPSEAHYIYAAVAAMDLTQDDIGAFVQLNRIRKIQSWVALKEELRRYFSHSRHYLEILTSVLVECQYRHESPLACICRFEQAAKDFGDAIRSTKWVTGDDSIKVKDIVPMLAVGIMRRDALPSLQRAIDALGLGPEHAVLDAYDAIDAIKPPAEKGKVCRFADDPIPDLPVSSTVMLQAHPEVTFATAVRQPALKVSNPSSTYSRPSKNSDSSNNSRSQTKKPSQTSWTKAKCHQHTPPPAPPAKCTVTCFSCGKRGHYQSECYKPKSPQGNHHRPHAQYQGNRHRPQAQYREGVCMYHNTSSHTSNECYKLRSILSAQWSKHSSHNARASRSPSTSSGEEVWPRNKRKT